RISFVRGAGSRRPGRLVAERAADAFLRGGGEEVAQRSPTGWIELVPRGNCRREIHARRMAVHAPQRAAAAGFGDAGALVGARAGRVTRAAQDSGATGAIAIAPDLLFDEHLERLVE